MGPAPVAVAAGTPCADVVRRMREAGASGAIVVDHGEIPAGIVTEQDVCRRITFVVPDDTPVEQVMSAPVRSIRESDYLYHGIARMRRGGLRHMPVVDDGGRVTGILHLHEALGAAASRMVANIDRLTHAETVEGMGETKAAQASVAAELLQDLVPVPDIQALLTSINRDIHARICALCVAAMEQQGRGPPPVEFDVIIMGSGGRGESYLMPDQDNGFILADYPDQCHAEIDPWFIELAEHMTKALNQVGFVYCPGNVMAVNPLWRKTLTQWREQTTMWVNRGEGQFLRLSDIFFDFVPVYGSGELTRALREHVTGHAGRTFFLREMFKNDEEHGVALGLFNRFITERRAGPNRGKMNLKLTGTLPLVGAVRIMALKEHIGETSTLARMQELRARGILGENEHDYLLGAYRHITYLLLRQQLEDFEAGNAVSNYVPPSALTRRERDMLVNGFKAIRSFRSRVRHELSGEIF